MQALIFQILIQFNFDHDYLLNNRCRIDCRGTGRREILW